MNVLFSVKTVSFSLLVAWPTTILFAFLQQIGLHFHLFMENGNTTQLLLFAVLRAWQLFDTLPCFLELGLQFIQLLVHLVQVWWVFFNTANTHTHTQSVIIKKQQQKIVLTTDLINQPPFYLLGSVHFPSSLRLRITQLFVELLALYGMTKKKKKEEGCTEHLIWKWQNALKSNQILLISLFNSTIYGTTDYSLKPSSRIVLIHQLLGRANNVEKLEYHRGMVHSPEAMPFIFQLQIKFAVILWHIFSHLFLS